jgi:hypothetical protein
MVGSTLGVYSFGLIFVSARTNKRHHHHQRKTSEGLRMPPPLRHRRCAVVDISDIAIIPGIIIIINMVKVIILVINNTPQKTYRFAQYTDSWNQLHSLRAGQRHASLRRMASTRRHAGNRRHTAIIF